jgi:hypothetical protein
MKKFALLSLLLLATAAFAIQQLDLTVSPRLQSILSGIIVGPRSIQATDALINANRETRSLGAQAVIDFASATITTVDSSAITVLGARTGDPCFVGPPAAVVVNASFTCLVTAADTVKVRFTPAGTAADPLSGTYFIRVISSQ